MCTSGAWTHPELTYGWLQPQVPHPIHGDIEGIKHQRFDARHLQAEARFADVEAFVHVQAAVGTPDPVAETRWLSEMAEADGQPAEIVAHADLAGSDIGDVLDRHAGYAGIRGIRDFAVKPALAAADSERLDRGPPACSCDAGCSWTSTASGRTRRLRRVWCAATPTLVVVLEHPPNDEGWKQHRALSAAPNVQYKISEIGMGDPR